MAPGCSGCSNQWGVCMVTVPQTSKSKTTNMADKQEEKKQTTEVLSVQGLNVNARYFSTLPGILKIIEWVLAIICIACVSPAQFGGAHWFLFVVVICFILTFAWMCVHFFTMPEILPSLPWVLMEFGFTAAACVFYFLAAVVLLVQTSDTQEAYLVVRQGRSRWQAYITAGSFAIINCLVYGVECAWHFKLWRQSKQR